MKKESIEEISASLLILLFVYAAVSKLMDYQTFKLQLGQSPYITGYASILSWMVPAGELIIAACLMARSKGFTLQGHRYISFRTIGFYGAILIMTLFTSYIYAMIHFSYYLPCSCGGVLAKMSWPQHFWFNVGFTGIAIAGAFLHRGIAPAAQPQATPSKILSNAL